MHEFDIIRHYFRDRQLRPDVLLGPGDDAAILQAPAGHELVMTLDTLVEGRHFPADLPAHAIGFRSLATNLSDLAAMGAEPAWCLLSLSLPEARPAWLDDFCAGFFALADRAGISLVGGDLVRGSLAISIQATGFVPAGQALRRSGAQAGDLICIGGVPGEAAAGLAQWQGGTHDGELIERFCYPEPQLALGRSLRGHASACIDISDGLLADLGHLLEESGGLGAEIELARLPVSPSLATHDETQRLSWQLSGGDDYLLLFTLPSDQPLPSGCHLIGTACAEAGVRLHDRDGKALAYAAQGWQHF